MDKIIIQEKFNHFQDHWSPKIVGEFNENYIKLAKLKGEFIWHHHEDEDELFIIVKGNLQIKFRDKSLDLSEGEMVIIPKGIEHKPIANKEVHVILIEPKSTLNTGNVEDSKTIKELDNI